MQLYLLLRTSDDDLWGGRGVRAHDSDDAYYYGRP